MKTVIDISHHSADVDLSDIGDMIKKYCNKVEQLEEELGTAKEHVKVLERINKELEQAIDEYEGMA